jgi:hypothetical protein
MEPRNKDVQRRKQYLLIPLIRLRENKFASKSLTQMISKLKLARHTVI